MITELHIKNIGIIDEIVINLEEGFNVLTGETGAGKTLIVDSLNIICGGRFSKDMIRHNEKSCLVEACMYLPNCIVAEEGSVIVTREIFENGRNLCKINGKMVTVSELKEFMKYHLNVHGQFDNQLLLEEENHINYLDDYSNLDIASMKKEYEKNYNEYIRLNQELKENYGDDKERKRTLDILMYEHSEIESANLKIDEEEILRNKIEILSNREKILQNLEMSKTYLSEEILPKMDEVLRSLSKISTVDIVYETFLNNIQEYYYNLEDTNFQISKRVDELDYFDENPDELLNRMDTINNLKRKYGSSIKEILAYDEDVINKINRINSVDEINKQLSEKIEVIENTLFGLSQKLNKIRVEKASELEEKINKNFEELEMKNAKIRIEVSKLIDKKFNINGLDKVRFLIKTNEGDEFKELIKVASGGEISRIILAMKSAIAESDKTEICVFDEIDTGISGKAANAVGAKIKEIAKYHQVICVTHLATVAAFANYHFYISKKVEDGITKTEVRNLTEEEKTNELARISAGNITNASIKYALELRNNAVLV